MAARMICRTLETGVSSWSTGTGASAQGAFPCREPDSMASSAAGCSTSRSSCCTGARTPIQLQIEFSSAGGRRQHRVPAMWVLESSRPVLVSSSSRHFLTEAHRSSTLPFDPLRTAGLPSVGDSNSKSFAFSIRSQPKSRQGMSLLRPQARLDNDDSEAARRQSTSSASLFSSGSQFKCNRLDSTLPLSANASSFKASVRVLYSLATHGGLIAFGCLICQLTGTNIVDMIHLDSMDALRGLLLAVPPILLASFLQLEFLVQSWEVARGVRDAEDEELVEYYLGMTPSQYIPVAVASAVSQEVFFRAALQGGLALAFHLGGTAGLDSNNLLQHLGAPSAVGMAAVSGFFPAFAPFSQLHAAVVMAAMTGSFDYAASLRSVPNVIVTDGRNLEALRTTFGEWYQRQQLKSIYAPMFTGMLALYFGLEWILVGNLMAPMISHSLYLSWSMMAGLARLDRSR